MNINLFTFCMMLTSHVFGGVLHKFGGNAALQLRHPPLALGILVPQQFPLQPTSDWLLDVGQMRCTVLARDLRAKVLHELMGAARVGE